MRIRDRINLRSEFLRNVGILTGGTVFAQGLMALALPVLTRLYTPEDFNLLAVYSALLALVAVIACMRYNIAIPLPEDDAEALRLLALSIVLAMASAAAVAVPVVFAPAWMARQLGQPAIEPYLWMVPVGVVFAAVYDALQYWASRKKRFSMITATRVTRAVGGSATQLGIGAVSPSPFGLIFGQVVYSGVGIVGLARPLWREDRASLRPAVAAGLAPTARRYRAFPLFSVPEALFNAAGAEISILIIAAVAAGPEAGFLMLAMRVMGLPMGLVGSSVAQVYLAEAGERLRKGELAAFTWHTMRTLLRTGAPLLLLAGLVSPLAFPFVFGAEWSRAGIIVAWLTPMFILQLVSSPFSMAPHVVGKVAWAMWLQVAGGAMRVGAVAYAGYAHPAIVVEVFAISSALFYVFAILLIQIVIRRTPQP